jgi:hypothetical protein
MAGSDTNSLSCDDIMQGLKSHSKADTYPELMDRQHWMMDVRGKQAMLTNEVERIRLAKELIQILNSEKSSEEDKGAAAYLIGLFRFKEGIKALINNFMLWSKAANEPDSMPVEGECPAQYALKAFGEPAIPEVIGLIESTTNSFLLHEASWVILHIKGQEEGAAFLKQAIANQTDSKKKENLKAALSSEYFADPKYHLSGPRDKVKAMLAQERQNAGVTNKPEGK